MCRSKFRVDDFLLMLIAAATALINRLCIQRDDIRVYHLFITHRLMRVFQRRLTGNAVRLAISSYFSTVSHHTQQCTLSTDV